MAGEDDAWYGPSGGAPAPRKDGQDGVYFAVWAPKAAAVHLIGSFNEWDETSHVMTRREPLGIYDLFVPGVKKGDMYGDSGILRGSPCQSAV